MKLNGVVAYHDACHLSHAQKVRQQPRELLTAIPGLTLREIAAYDTVADVLAAGWDRDIEPVVPRLELGPDGNHVLLPGGRRLELPPGFPR